MRTGPFSFSDFRAAIARPAAPDPHCRISKVTVKATGNVWLLPRQPVDRGQGEQFRTTIQVGAVRMSDGLVAFEA